MQEYLMQESISSKGVSEYREVCTAGEYLDAEKSSFPMYQGQ